MTLKNRAKDEKGKEKKIKFVDFFNTLFTGRSLCFNVELSNKILKLYLICKP